MAATSPQPQVAQLSCPNCQQTFRTTIHSLVDATQQPDLKQTLVAGRLNIATCTSCGAATMIATPLIYHDISKQACFVYIPQEMKMSAEDQERFIGEMSSAITQTLPEDAPRGYLLTPKRFMTLQSLVDAILEADGIPKEVVEQQRKRVEIISSLAGALEDDETFAQLVQEHQEDFNYEFFATLSAFIDASAQENQHESVELLVKLREKLAKQVGFEEEFESPSTADADEVLQRLMDTAEEELEQVVAETRPVIDYALFQAWASQIEALEQEGKTDEAEKMKQRRTLVHETVERLDKEAQAIFEGAANALQEIVQAEDPQQALKQHKEHINEAFMLIASSNIESARRHGDEEAARRLEDVSRMAIEFIQSQLPPEERFINELLLCDTPKESIKLLRENMSMVTPEFVKKLNSLADDQDKQGVKETAKRLRQIARDASAMLY